MTSTYCQICQSGYIVNTYGKCVSNSGFNGMCNISNCNICTNSTSCGTCASGYQLSAAAPFTCVSLPCTLIGCQVCASSTTCSSCSYGYILNTTSNQCMIATSACSITNCISCLNAGNGQSCSACSAGY